MPIPLSRLETWSNIGSTGVSTNAYNSIRTALFKVGSPVNVPAGDVFLQGSYANSTNIHGDSDVDVVVLYNETFTRDLSALASSERQKHEIDYGGTATYKWENHRQAVLTALQNHFGAGSVTAGRKSIKVKTGVGRQPSDVVPAIQFRKYATYPDRHTFTAHWGITFFDSANNQVNNYPKYHIERGEDKNKIERTAGKYKKTIRVFKNLRNYMIDNGYISDKTAAPSYFIECALHNVPDELFTGELDESIPAIIAYLRLTPFAGFLCQNGVTTLIGDSPTHWNSDNYVNFVMSAQRAWDEYYD